VTACFTSVSVTKHLPDRYFLWSPDDENHCVWRWVL